MFTRDRLHQDFLSITKNATNPYPPTRHITRYDESDFQFEHQKPLRKEQRDFLDKTLEAAEPRFSKLTEDQEDFLNRRGRYARCGGFN